MSSSCIALTLLAAACIHIVVGQPANDDCSGAEVIQFSEANASGVTVNFNLTSATPQPSIADSTTEMFSGCFVPNSLLTESNDDVWFRWDANTTFLVELESFFAGLLLEIRVDSSPTCSSMINGTGGAAGRSQWCIADLSGTLMRFYADSGYSYFFRIGRITTAPSNVGSFTLTPTIDAPISGDRCQTAISITENTFPINFNTDPVGSTASLSLPPAWCELGRSNLAADIWYSFPYNNYATTGTGVPRFTIHTCGSQVQFNVDTMMQVFDGSFFTSGCPATSPPTDPYLPVNQAGNLPGLITVAPEDGSVWCADDVGVDGYPFCPGLANSSGVRDAAIEFTKPSGGTGPLLIRLSSWRNFDTSTANPVYRFNLTIDCVDSVDPTIKCALPGTDGDGAGDGSGDGSGGAKAGAIAGGVVGGLAVLWCFCLICTIIVILIVVVVALFAGLAGTSGVLLTRSAGAKESLYEEEMTDDPSTEVDPREDGFTFKQISMDEISIKRKLGQGAFGTVYKGVWHKQPVAVKIVNIRGNDKEVLLEFKREAEVMHLLGFHRRLVKFIGAVVEGGEYALVTGFCERGSLYDILIKKSEAIEHGMIVQMARDAAEGLCHLHSEGVIHRDIAARNILVNKDWSVQVADFGMSRLFDKDEGGGATKSNIGPVRYMAPEALSKDHIYSEKSDVFSFGVLLWEMLERTDPWHGEDAWRVAAKVVDGERLPISDRDPVLADLMRRCWEDDPADRPTMSEVYDMLCQHFKTLNPDAESESVSEAVFDIGSGESIMRPEVGEYAFPESDSGMGGDSASTWQYTDV